MQLSEAGHSQSDSGDRTKCIKDERRLLFLAHQIWVIQSENEPSNLCSECARAPGGHWSPLSTVDYYGIHCKTSITRAAHLTLPCSGAKGRQITSLQSSVGKTCPLQVCVGGGWGDMVALSCADSLHRNCAGVHPAGQCSPPGSIRCRQKSSGQTLLRICRNRGCTARR